MNTCPKCKKRKGKMKYTMRDIGDELCRECGVKWGQEFNRLFPNYLTVIPSSKEWYEAWDNWLTTIQKEVVVFT